MTDLFSATIRNVKFSAAEMIGTIIKIRASGEFGECVGLAYGGLRITLVTGLTVIAYSDAANGLHSVEFKGMVGTDTDPENAARLALDAGRGIDVSRNYSI